MLLLSLAFVAVRNFWGEKEISDDVVLGDQLSPIPLSPPVATPRPDLESWKIFQSKDQSFRLHYPPAWVLEEKAAIFRERGVYGVTVQAWSLKNFSDRDQEVSIEGVRMEFEISTEGRKQTPSSLIDCQSGKIDECQDQLVNGVTYKKTVSKLEEGESLMMATVKNDRIYRISATITSPSEEVSSELKEIINSFEILESS